ncbi:MAG: DUF3152 domain-containing protein [Nitriliruptoraceae bacterium]
MRRTLALGLIAGVVLAVPALTGPVVGDGAPLGDAAVAVAAPAPAAAADGPAPAPPTPDAPGPVADAGGAAAGGIGPGGAGTAPTATSPEGHLIAPGGAAAGTGPVLRYSVEVDPVTGLDPVEVAAIAETALGDVRSWARIRRLVRTDDPATADARLLVAPPAVVDALCAEAGLNTAGVYSCWNGRFVALNALRWTTGAFGFPDVATYRLYLVNHEVGHVLGRGHVGCPADGAVAPLMMQQTKGLGGCVANGWPFPG